MAGAAWPPAASVMRGSGAHPVMDRLLHSQPALPASIPPYQERNSAPPRRRMSSGRAGGKRGAMFVALFMAGLVIAGTSWFFRDQLKAAWLTYTMKDEDSASGVPSAKPKTDGSAKQFDPTSPPLPKAVPVAQPITPPTQPPIPPEPTPPQSVIVLPAIPVGSPSPTNSATASSTGSLVEVPGTSSAGPPVNVVPSPPPVPALVTGMTDDSKPALETLQRFFQSKTWRDRLPYVQAPNSMEPIMHDYYRDNADGPLHPSHIEVMSYVKEPETGPPHCVFQVSGGGLKQPLPIMVEHAEEGWKVDWLTFTEFRDELLLKFLESPQAEPARFHVLMRRAHYFDDDVPALDKKTCFQVMPPMPGFTGDVFALKGTPVARDLDKHVGWDVSQQFAVVELQWRKDDQYKWVELTSLVQLNWRNVEPSAVKTTVGASSKKKDAEPTTPKAVRVE